MNIVRLTDLEREELIAVISKLKGTSQKVRLAHILLQADTDGPSWVDQRIADAFDCRRRTVETVRERFVTDGFKTLLNGKKRETPPVAKKLTGEEVAKIIALRLGSPPAGYANWSLRLLAGHVVELGIVDSISHETLRQTFKKMA